MSHLSGLPCSKLQLLLRLCLCLPTGRVDVFLSDERSSAFIGSDYAVAVTAAYTRHLPSSLPGLHQLCHRRCIDASHGIAWDGWLLDCSRWCWNIYSQCSC
jgi:hypothetical protein